MNRNDPTGNDGKVRFCPECGEQLGSLDNVFVFEGSGSIAGCNICLRIFNAQEWFDEVEEEASLLSKNYEDDCFSWGNE